MIIEGLTNQRPISRSCDLIWPIRGQCSSNLICIDLSVASIQAIILHLAEAVSLELCQLGPHQVPGKLDPQVVWEAHDVPRPGHGHHHRALWPGVWPVLAPEPMRGEYQVTWSVLTNERPVFTWAGGWARQCWLRREAPALASLCPPASGPMRSEYKVIWSTLTNKRLARLPVNASNRDKIRPKSSQIGAPWIHYHYFASHLVPESTTERFQACPHHFLLAVVKSAKIWMV